MDENTKTIKENKENRQYDIIFITADEYFDHPNCGIAILKRVLEDKGYSVEVISKPNWNQNDDFLKLGTPKLFFGITSGPVDSMLNNYTPLKKKRNEDEYLKESNKNYNPMPDRAVTVYCNKIRELFKDSLIVIGGVESSLRRFAHYDYWQNRVRKSILLDSRADCLVYGNGEKQIIEISSRIKETIDKNKPAKKADLENIEGTCVLTKHLPDNAELLPDFELVCNEDFESKKNFCKMQMQFSMDKALAQKYDKKYVVQYKYPIYTTEDLDYYYSFDYKRNIPAGAQLDLARFSITTHRGCLGKCSFCSIALHQGTKIISRSEESILNEIKRIAKHPNFNGEIEDIGGPSANMYGMDFTTNGIDTTHKKLIALLRKARDIEGIKHVYVQSGIRYDFALKSEEYVKELVNNHLREYLIVAPEHFSSVVTKLMGKPNDCFDDFVDLFNKVNENKKKYLKTYLMVGHPGTTEEENKILALKSRLLKNPELTQVFTPTPMTISTCMYWTGLNPYNLENIYVPYSYIEKKKQKRMIVK